MEIRTGERYEYHDGEVFKMSGASGAHARLAASITCEVVGRIKGTNCWAYSGDLRIAIPPGGTYLHPDLTVTCGRLQSEIPGRHAYTNPKVIFEVLSNATETYDRSAKFDLFRRIPTFEEYVLISQVRYAVDRFHRNGPDDAWWFTRYRGTDAVLELESLAVSIPLIDIYDGVDFEFADRPPSRFDLEQLTLE